MTKTSIIFHKKIEANFAKTSNGAFETRYLLLLTATLSTLDTATWILFSYSQLSHALNATNS